MKFGVRTPSIKRSIKSRTTGRIKRSVKSSLNPLYGNKGMGYVNNPKKAIYNKVYRKTSFSAIELLKPSLHKASNNHVLLNEIEIHRNFEFLDSGICGPLIVISILPIFICWFIGGFVQLFSPGMGGLLKGIAYILILADVIGLIRMFYIEHINNETLSNLSYKLNRSLSKNDVEGLEHEMYGYFQIIAEHLQLLNQSNDIENFLYEYTFVTTVLQKAICIEDAFIIESGLPSEILENLENSKSTLINDLIETHYTITKEKIESLKTIKAKINNANKFKEKFEEHLSELPEDCVVTFKNLYESLMQLTLEHK